MSHLPAPEVTSFQHTDDTVADEGGLDFLPDLDELKARAIAHRQRFVLVRDEAQKEIDKADAYLSGLGGGVKLVRKNTGKRHGKRQSEGVGQGIYDAVITRLAEMSYGSAKTIGNQVGVSSSHMSAVMRRAVSDGYVRREPRGHGYRYFITDEGVEYATKPKED